MSSLIKNELIKIFKKKSIYIILLITLIFVIFINCIYKFIDNVLVSIIDGFDDEYEEYLEEEVKKLDPNKQTDVNTYIELKSELELAKIAKKYEKGAWQREKVSELLYDYVNEKNMYLYDQNKNQEEANKIQEKINEIVNKLDEGDWESFVKDEIQNAEDNIKELEAKKESTVDKKQLNDLEISIKQEKVTLEVAEYRLNKNIKYGNDFMNEALSTYKNQSINVIENENNVENLDYKEKLYYNSSLEEKEISKYIIENNVDINKSDDIRGILKNFFSNYGLFIILIIVMIAGTIVSEEFNKGTIKLLLIKPYSRNKILLAKFITVLIMIIFAIASILIMELLVGGVVFGYDSLSIPVLEYNFNTGSLEVLSIFTYLGIQIITQLPIYVLLATLAFACSTIFVNSPLAISISLLGYMTASTINLLVISNKIEFMKFFVSLNWNFSEYLYGNLPQMEGLTPIFSAVICAVYFAIMIMATFITFKKKNIKNI